MTEGIRLNRELRRELKIKREAPPRSPQSRPSTPFQHVNVDEMKRAPANMHRAYTNGFYVVMVFQQQTAWGLIEDAMVQRYDAAPIRSWNELQRIKNELFGKERTAVEVYPAESDLCDVANIYHLWILPEGFHLPFGLHREELFVARPVEAVTP
jgi:hypothetical protein